MGNASLKCAASTLAFLLSWLFMPAHGPAQESQFLARQSLSGRQLFEHEWKWKGSFAESPGGREQVRSGQPANRTRALRLGDGLGPLHNATSCSQCHLNGGASGVRHNVTLITVDPRSDALKDKAEGGVHLLGVFPGLLTHRGILNFTAVVHDRSTRPGYATIRRRLTTFVPDGIDDQWFQPEARTSAAIANRPVVAGRNGPVDFYLSQRNSPALYGAGLIDSINDGRLHAIATKQAKKTDGKVSGRFVGKFGWRGQVNSLATFVSQACAAELGLSHSSAAPVRSTRGRSFDGRTVLFNASQAGDPADFDYRNTGQDMTSEEVIKLTRFVAALPRPTEQRRAIDTVGDVVDGEMLFGSVGCAVCHIADVRPATGIFSDLLLHDMGLQLQSPMPAPVGSVTSIVPFGGQAFGRLGFKTAGPFVSSPQQYYGSPRSSGSTSVLPQPYPILKPVSPQFPRGEVPDFDTLYWDTFQREWRTPPLWGVADTAPYLHDGRAETLEDAILWHGGEAESSRNMYAELSRENKDAVLAFLSSLRAPETSTAP